MGGAMGLRAIGWYFKRGPVLFCPAHRPDASILCKLAPKSKGMPCSQCTGIVEAEKFQQFIERQVNKREKK
jgi:hypothetical protein